MVLGIYLVLKFGEIIVAGEAGLSLYQRLDEHPVLG